MDMIWRKGGRKDKKKKGEKQNSLTRLTRETACPTPAAHPRRRTATTLKPRQEVEVVAAVVEGARTS